MNILFYLVLMLISLIAIVLSCVVFTNAIEHLGEHLGLSNRTMGSIFAAIGTGLPETIVPLVAIFGAYFAGQNMDFSKQIGIGAILGSPFMISTFAIFVTAVFILVFYKINKRKLDVNADTTPILRDLRFFITSYTIALIASFVKFPCSKFVFAILLLGIYVFYIIKTILKDNGEEQENEEPPLYFQICPTNSTIHSIILIIQILVSIVGIIYFSHLFVNTITFFAQLTHINPMILSLFLAPIATELPEIINSIIWVKESKDNLALANLTGAIVYQSAVLTAIGVLLTHWQFGLDGLINVILVYASVITLYFAILKNKNKLSVNILYLSGLYWFLYIIYVFLIRG